MGAELRVPKLSVPVGLTLEDGVSLECEVYVLPLSGGGAGRERIVDLLNSSEPYLPIASAGTTLMVRKDGIVLARLTEGLDAGVPTREVAPVPLVAVEVSLRGLPGSSGPIRGRLRLDMPPRSRLLDYMNAVVGFFPLLQDGRIVLVNPRFVRHVRPQPERKLAAAKRAAPGRSRVRRKR